MDKGLEDDEFLKPDFGWEHTRIRRITLNWLRDNPRGAKSSQGFHRDKDSLFLNISRMTWSFHDTIAIKRPETDAKEVLFNTDVFSSGHQKVTQRVSAADNVVSRYCALKNSPSLFYLPFSVPNKAGINIRTMEIFDSGHKKYGLLVGNANKRLLIISSLSGSLVHPNCKTLDDAFDFLKPEEVKKAEQKDKKVIRQGDWFFVPMPELADALIRRMTREKLYRGSDIKGYSLPHERGHNVHVAYAGCLYKGDHYATGTLRHHRSSSSVNKHPYTPKATGQHGMLTLDGVYLAVKNRSLGNFSSAARSD